MMVEKFVTSVEMKKGKSVMANLQNNKLIDVEQHFWDLLNDYGMTNDQALNVIKEKHGSIGYDHALSLINEQDDEEQKYQQGA